METVLLESARGSRPPLPKADVEKAFRRVKEGYRFFQQRFAAEEIHRFDVGGAWFSYFGERLNSATESIDAAPSAPATSLRLSPFWPLKFPNR